MSFIQAVIKNPTRSLILATKGSSVAVTKGYVAAYSSGLAINGTSATTRPNVIGVFNETQASGDGLTQASVIEPFPQDVWIVDSTNNSNAAHNGQFMVLGANGGVVNNTGTTDTAGIVQQVGVYGAAADKKILVKFAPNV
jgi:hypothetical protein